MQKNKDSYKGVFFVVISAISFSLLPIFAKFVYASGIDIFSMLFLRFFLASILLLPILRIRNVLNIPNLKVLISLLILGGVGYFLQSFLYLSSINYIPVSVAVLLLYTFPPMVMLISYAMGIEKMAMSSIIAIVLGFTGLYFVANPSYDLNFFGVTLAIAAAFVYSNYIVFTSKVLRNIKEELGSFYIMISASFSFLLITFIKGFNINYSGILWILLMALISTMLGITTFFMGLRLIGPTRTSIISLLEPVASILLSFLIFYERFNYFQALGAILIIIAAGLSSIKR